MGNLKSFDIKRLRPFRKSGNRMPRTVPDEDDKIAKLDHDLQPEEQAYVRHYVKYADVLLDEQQSASESGNNVVEMPSQNSQNKEKQSSEHDNGNKAA